jgi:hypothetical protein
VQGIKVSFLLNKTIRLFLDSIGRREEYEYYLERFRADRPRAFAVLCPLRAGFEDAASVFAFDLEFLLRLELDPIILLSGPDAIEMRDLLFAGPHPFVTFSIDAGNASAETMAVAILERLEDCRNHSRVLVLIDPESSLEHALHHVVPAISRRVHFIRVSGPLHDASGDALYYYYTQRSDRVELSEDDRELGQIAGRLLAAAPGTHISVASPLQLLQELFTVRGAGCVVRTGSDIHHYKGCDGVQHERLVALLEASFGRAVLRTGFLDSISDSYIESNYLGAALLEPHGTLMYLSKFAVQAGSRGEGLAQELWRTVTRDHAAIFWRSRVGNPINHWYEKLSEGCQQIEGWIIFWRGIEPAKIPDVIAFALRQEDAFASPASIT